MRDQRVYAAGAAAVKVSQSQTAAAHLISSGKTKYATDFTANMIVVAVVNLHHFVLSVC